MVVAFMLVMSTLFALIGGESVGGGAGYALRMGSSSTLKTNLATGFGKEFSVEIWVNSNGAEMWTSLWRYVPNNGGTQVGLSFSNHGFRIEMGTIELEVPYSVELGIWLHVYLGRSVDGTIDLYLDGEKMNTQKTSRRINFHPLDSLVPNDTKLCRAFGGYRMNITKCVFPFTFEGNTYNSCVDVLGQVIPYSDEPRESPADKFWCAITPTYSTEILKLRKLWGYCDCPYFSNASFVGNSGLVRFDVTEVLVLDDFNYMRPYYATDTFSNIYNISLISLETMDGLNTKKKQYHSKFGYVVMDPHEIITYEQVQKMISLGASMILIILPEAYSLGDVKPYYGFQMSCIDLHKGFDSNVIKGSYRCLNQYNMTLLSFRNSITSNYHCSSSCDPCTSTNLIDGDLLTEWMVEKSPGILPAVLIHLNEIVYTKDITHYSLVSTRTVAFAATIQVRALIEKQEFHLPYREWVIVETNSISISQGHFVKWCSISIPGNFKVVQIELQFLEFDGNILGLADFGLFNRNGESIQDSSMFRDGPVDSTSWYASRASLSVVHDLIDIPIIILERDSSVIKNALESVSTAGFYEQMERSTVFKDDLSQSGEIIIGPVDGIIDEFRVWRKNYLPTDTTSTRWLSCSILDSLDLEICKTFDLGFENECADTAREPFLPSLVPIVGADIVFGLDDRTATSIAGNIKGVFTNNGRYSFKVDSLPSFGEIRRIDFVDSELLERGVKAVAFASFRYRFLDDAQDDTFSIMITNPDLSITSVMVRIVIKLGELQIRKWVIQSASSSNMFNANWLSPVSNRVYGVVLENLPKSGTLLQFDSTSDLCGVKVFVGKQLSNGNLLYVYDKNRSVMSTDTLHVNYIDLSSGNVVSKAAIEMIFINENIAPRQPVNVVGNSILVNGSVVVLPIEDRDFGSNFASIIRSKPFVMLSSRPLFHSLYRYDPIEWVLLNRSDYFRKYNMWQLDQQPDIFPSSMFQVSLRNHSFCEFQCTRRWEGNNCEICRNLLMDQLFEQTSSMRIGHLKGDSGFIDLELFSDQFLSALKWFKVTGLNIWRVSSSVSYELFCDSSLPSVKRTMTTTSGKFLLDICTPNSSFWEIMWVSFNLADSSEFQESICWSSVEARYVRFEFVATSNFDQKMDGFRYESFRIPPRLPIQSTENSILVLPEAGMYGTDIVEYYGYDCHSFSSLESISLSTDYDEITTYSPLKPLVLLPHDKNISNSTFSIDLSSVFNDLNTRLTRFPVFQSKNSQAIIRVETRLHIIPAFDVYASNLGPAPKLFTFLLDDIPIGIDETLSFNAEFSMLTIEDKTITVGYSMRSRVIYECPVNEGQCSSSRIVLPGFCPEVSTTNRRVCSCVGEDLVTGFACEHTAWELCNSRGTPYVTEEDTLRCNCFEPARFGGAYCQVRANSVQSRSELYDELVNITHHFKRIGGLELRIIEDNDILSLEVRNEAFEDLSRQLTSSSTINSFNYSIESDSRGTCYGHGTPTFDGGCTCRGFYEPPNCISITRCQSGEYINYFPNPDYNRTNGQPEEFVKCISCPVGFECDSRNINPCKNGTFAHRQGMAKCQDKCENVGDFMLVNYSSVNNLSCERCSTGFYCDGRIKTACGPGLYSPEPRASQCMSCAILGNQFYSDTPASRSCNVCPKNTLRFGGAADTILDCFCLSGYWNGIPNDVSRSGIPCVPCPDFGECIGSTYFLSTRRNTSTRLLVQSNNIGPEPMEGFWGDINFPTKFYECEDGACGIGFNCSVGYSGIFCTTCSDGYFALGMSACEECPQSYTASFFFTVVAITAILALWSLLNTASNEVETLDILLLYVQIVSLVQDFDLTWPSPVSIYEIPFALTDFDVDFVSPQCIIDWTYTSHYVVQYSLPLAYVLVQLILSVCARAKVYSSASCSNAEAKSTSSKLKSGFKHSGGLGSLGAGFGATVAKFATRIFSLPSTRQELTQFTNHQISKTLNFFIIVYNSFCLAVLDALVCIDLPAGKKVMASSPTTECYSNEHFVTYIVWSAIGLAVFVIGLPLFIWRILHVSRTKNLKGDPEFMARYGELYKGFKPETLYWTLLILARRWIFVMLVILGRDHGYIQGALGCLVLGTMLCLQIFYYPYLSSRSNLLDSICIVSTMLYLFLGVIFQAYADASVEDSFSLYTVSIFSWMLFIVTASTLLLGFYLFIKDTRDYFRAIEASNSLVVQARSQIVALIRSLRSVDRHGAHQLVLYQLHHLINAYIRHETVDARHRSWFYDICMKVLATFDCRCSKSKLSNNLDSDLFKQIDLNSNGYVEAEEVKSFLKLVMNFKSPEVMNSVDRLCTTFDTNGDAKLDLQEFNEMLDRNLEVGVSNDILKYAIRSKYLNQWVSAKNIITPLQVALFFELDKQMTFHLAGDSPASNFETSFTSKFYRKLSDHFPFIFDWALTAPESDVAAFRLCLSQIEALGNFTKGKGTYSHIVDPLYISPYFYWSLHTATEEERAATFLFLSSIVASWNLKNENSLSQRFIVDIMHKEGNPVDAENRHAISLQQL